LRESERERESKREREREREREGNENEKSFSTVFGGTLGHASINPRPVA